MTRDASEPVTLATEAPPAFPKQLGEPAMLLDDLGREFGVRIGVHEHIRLAKLLYRMRGRGIELTDAETAARYIAPVVAKSQDEQDVIFSEIRRRWSAFQEPAPTPEVDLETKKTRVAKTAHKQERQLSLRWILSAGFVVLALLVFGLIVGGDSRIVLDDGPKPKATPEFTVEDLRQFLQKRGNFILALLPIIGGFGFVIWSRHRRMALVRDFTLREVEGAEQRFDADLPTFFSDRALPPAFQALARHQEVASERIDVRASIRATIHAGGLIQLRHGIKPQLPDYHLWVDVTSRADHVSALADDLEAQLHHYNIHVMRFEFRRAPHRLYRRMKGGDDTHVVELSNLLATADQKRLLIVSDAVGFFPPFSDRPHRWLTALARAQHVALLTPKQMERWGAREEALALRGIDVFPATPSGLVALARRLGDEPWTPIRTTTVEGSDSADPVSRLQHHFTRWLEPEPLPAAEVHQTLDDLEQWLGPKAFELLAATAVYPEIRPELTRLLNDLIDESDATSKGSNKYARVSSSREVRFGAVAQLLWLREGRMPDWLREALLSRLAPETTARLRAALQTALMTTSDGGRLSLEIAEQSRWTLSEVLMTLMWEGRHRLRHDQVFLRFLRGERADRPEFAIGGSIVQRMRTKLALTEWMVLAGATFLAFAIPWLAGSFGLLGLIPQPATDGLQAPVDLKIWILSPLWVSATAGVTLLIASQAQRRWTIAAQVCLAVAIALGLVSVVVTNANVYMASTIGSGAALVLSWLLEGTRANRSIRPPANLFNGDRWLVSTAVLLVPVVVLVVAETALAEVISVDPSRAGENWLRAIAPVALGSLTAAFGLALLTRPRLATPFPDVLRAAAAFVLAELAVDSLIILLIEGGGPVWEPLLLDWTEGPLIETWSGLRQAAGVIAVTALLRRLGVVTGITLAWISSLCLLSIVSSIFVVSTDFANYLGVGHIYLSGVLIGCLLLQSGFPRIRYSLQLTFPGFVLIASTFSGLLSRIGPLDEESAAVVSGAFVILALVGIWPTMRVLYPGFWRPPKPHPSIDYAWSTDGKWWVWSLAPVLWLFFCMGYAIGPWRFTFDYLLIPVAAWLGARHGRLGLCVLIAGTLPLLVGFGFAGFSTWIPPPAMFFALMIVCRVFGQRGYRHDCLRADWISGRQLAYLFIILAVYIDFAETFDSVDVELSTRLADYTLIIFVLAGLSRISARRLFVPFLAITVLSFLVRSIQADYTFPRLSGFMVFFTYTSADYVMNALVMFLVGRLLRWRIAERQPLPPQQAVGLCAAALLFLALTSLSISYDFTFDNGLRLRPLIGFGGPFGAAALLFATGAVGGGRAALLGVFVALMAHILAPIIALNLHEGGAFDYDTMRMYLTENWALRWAGPGALVGAGYAVAPGWTIHPLDMLFPVFGWRVHQALLRQPKDLADQEAAIARISTPQFGLPVDLPPLRFRYMDRFWIWPTSLVVALGVAMVVGTLLFLAAQIISTP